LFVASGDLSCQDDGLSDAGMKCQRDFYLFKLDPVSANFYLGVGSSEEISENGEGTNRSAVRSARLR
jgi:hypothetical protein